MQLLCVLLIYSINLLFDENCRNVHVVINNVSIPVCFNAVIKCVYFLLSLFAALQVVWSVAVVLLVYGEIYCLQLQELPCRYG